jgi:mono/diheme cytochrome c family protein
MFPLVVLALAVAAAGPVRAADPDAGQRLAARWCAGCHVVGGRERDAQDSAPALPAIAKRQLPENRTWLRAWLSAPHPPMPDLGLSRQEIEDVAAFLDRLRS